MLIHKRKEDMIHSNYGSSSNSVAQDFLDGQPLPRLVEQKVTTDRALIGCCTRHHFTLAFKSPGHQIAPHQHCDLMNRNPILK